MDLDLEVGERSNQRLEDRDADIFHVLHIPVCTYACVCVLKGRPLKGRR